MKVCIYARVSTDDKNQNPDVQLSKCQLYCEMHNHKIIAEVIDNGVSGDTDIFSRPKGSKIEPLIAENQIEGLIVFSIDRYSRESPIKVLQKLNHLKEQGLTFISVTEPVFNMESEFAEPMKYLLSWFANYFLSQHKKKVSAGIDRAREKGTRSGKPIGRPKVKLNLYKVMQLSKIGYSQRQIAEQLDCSVATINRILKQKGADSQL